MNVSAQARWGTVQMKMSSPVAGERDQSSADGLLSKLVDIVAAPMAHVRMGLISPKDLSTVVMPQKLVPAQRIMDAMAFQVAGAVPDGAESSAQFRARSGKEVRETAARRRGVSIFGCAGRAPLAGWYHYLAQRLCLFLQDFSENFMSGTLKTLHETMTQRVLSSLSPR